MIFYVIYEIDIKFMKQNIILWCLNCVFNYIRGLFLVIIFNFYYMVIQDGGWRGIWRGSREFSKRRLGIFCILGVMLFIRINVKEEQIRFCRKFIVQRKKQLFIDYFSIIWCFERGLGYYGIKEEGDSYFGKNKGRFLKVIIFELMIGFEK